MGVNTKGFIHSENAKNFTWIDAFRYIDEKYGVTDISPGPGDYNYMRIGFNDGEDRRSTSIFNRYTSYVNEGYPEFNNENRSTILPNSKPYIVLFDLNYWGNSEGIIKDIVSHFGGGYFMGNDCSGEWEKI